jgi:hypothetical protein
MRARRLISLALAAVLALAVAGIAIAHGGGGQATKTEPAQATFTATPDAQKTKTRQCTGEDGTYNPTRGVYNGTSTGDPRLTGNITIKTKTIVNLDNGLGYTQGHVFLRDADTGKLKAAAGLNAVNTQRGKLDGFLLGKVKTPSSSSKAKSGHGHRHGGTSLAANFSATFNADGTQLTGELGSEAPVPPQNSAVFFGRPCKPTQSTQQQSGDDHRGGRGGDDDHR